MSLMHYRKTAARIGALAVAPLLASTATATTITGTFHGMSYTASNNIIGQTSTATIAGGGDPIYLATASKYRGVVGLLINEGAAGNFVCSGSLTADRRSIISAGHCITDGRGSKPVSVTAYFYNPVIPDPLETPVYTAGAPNVTTVAISAVHFKPLYTGEVIDDHDISVLTLAAPPPA